MSPASGESPAWASPSGLVLITALLVGGFALLSSALALALGSPLSNSSEWGLFVATLAVLTPASVAVGRALARKVDGGAGRRGLAELAAVAAIGVLGVVIAARASYAIADSSSAVMLGLGLLWAATLAWAARRLRHARRLLTDPHGARPWVAIAALAGLGSVAVFPDNFFHADELALSLVLTAALMVLHLRWRPTAPRWGGLLLDGAIVLLAIAIVTDVSGYLEYLRPDARTLVLGDGIPVSPQILTFVHQNDEGFVLGPLNDMLHGRAMLVGTSSQYGVGVYYFLAGIFQFAPLGYGALGLLSSLLTGLQFALAYGVMRLAGVARLLAATAIIAALLGLALGALGSYNDYPSKGALRYGIPWLIVAAALLAARRPQRQRALWAAATLLVACASVWSFETFAYAGATFTAAAAFEASTRARRQRLRTFAAMIAASAAACVAAHVILAVGTRVFAGAWPQWSTYLAYLDAYSGQSSLFAATVPWSPALGMLLVHLVSLICLAGLVARDHEVALARRPALMAIAACNGLGIASYSYWVGNSATYVLFFLALPVLVVATLWLSLADDVRARVPSALRITALAAGFWFAATLGISGWQDTKGKWRRTALAHALPWTGDEQSLPDAASRLWHNPPSNPQSVQAQTLLDRHLPPGAPALVLIESELSVETLVRSGRVNVLPISHPEQDNLVSEEVNPKVIATVDALRSGTLMLTQPAAWNAPLRRPAVYAPSAFVAVQRLALDRIRSRFELQIVERTATGLAIVRLQAKTDATG